ncbi:hypothetical protein OESDEN_12720, partial [Oesophagostomum dentatum]
SRLAAITVFAVIFATAFGGLKVDASTEDSANGLGGLFDIQKMLENFNKLTRGVLAPFQNLTGNTSPFNIRLPSLPDLSKLLGGFPIRLYREGQQFADSNSTIVSLVKSAVIALLLTEGFPTLPPLAPITLPDFLKLQTIAPLSSQCIPKLKKEFKENSTYFEEVKQAVDQNNITVAYDIVIAKAEEICTPEQVERLNKLVKKYETMKQNIQALAPEYPQDVKDKVMGWLRNDDMFSITNFLGQESLVKWRALYTCLVRLGAECNATRRVLRHPCAQPININGFIFQVNLFNFNKNSKLTQTSFQLASMNMDLLFSPI